MALSKNTPVTLELGDINELPVKASVHIYAGAAVGMSSGYARPLNAGDPFRGFADREADNSSGSNGSIAVRLLTEGSIQLAISGLAVTDEGKAVYASDDGTYTLTATSNSFVGRVKRFVSSGVGIVAFCVGEQTGSLGALTDSSTGTAGSTVGDVGGTFNQANINNNFATLTAKINALAKMLA